MKPPYLETVRVQVSLSRHAKERIVRLSELSGLSRSRVVDALVRVRMTEGEALLDIRQVLDEDTRALAQHDAPVR